MQKPGVCKERAAALLMKALYLARTVRLDLNWVMNTISRQVTKWTVLQDRHICRLYGYLMATVELELHSVVFPGNLGNKLEGYPDADLAGAFDSARSTSGGFVGLAGDAGTSVPLEWYSKRQTATSHSTTEAELASASKMLREHLLPQQILWEAMLGRPVSAKLFEVNQSTIATILNGYSQQLRFLAKCHRIYLFLVHEICTDALNSIALEYIPTDLQKGDLMTRGLERGKLEKALELVKLRMPVLVAAFCAVLRKP
jgi:hypothetical protein